MTSLLEDQENKEREGRKKIKSFHLTFGLNKWNVSFTFSFSSLGIVIWSAMRKISKVTSKTVTKCLKRDQLGAVLKEVSKVKILFSYSVFWKRQEMHSILDNMKSCLSWLFYFAYRQVISVQILMPAILFVNLILQRMFVQSLSAKKV